MAVAVESLTIGLKTYQRRVHCDATLRTGENANEFVIRRLDEQKFRLLAVCERICERIA